MKPTQRQPWSAEEIELLKAEYADSPTADLARRLGHKTNAVYQKANALGIQKSAAFFVNERAGRIMRGKEDPRMRATQWTTGNNPWNKNRKGWDAGGRSEQTRFKKGSAPHNTLLPGQYRLCEGQLQRKTSETPGPNYKRWTPVSRIVWESVHGLVPPGHIVVFKPGRKTATLELITPDALECITRADNARRNHIKNKSPELAKLVQLKGAITRQVNRITREAKKMEPRMLSVEERCIAAYRSSPDLNTACQTAGVHKLTMFKILKMNGVMLIADRLKIGSPGSRMGASAEQEFLRLVPAAKSINAICSSNPGFDFDVNGWRVDVKAAGPMRLPARKTPALRWQPRVSNGGPVSEHVDLFCLFLLFKPEAMAQECGYKLYLLPADLVRGRRYISKTEGIPSELDEFEVQPDQLANFFNLETAAQS